MDDVSQPRKQQLDLDDPAVEIGTELLRTLFAESDIVLFRPIETWVKAGHKHSRVDYRRTCYRRAFPAALQAVMATLLKLAAAERVNLFFGVCPRLGRRGHFDLAWQIRTVRSLWTDIDHVAVDEALEGVAKANLPLPSVVVNSGNGAHLYWLLDEPYQIDDAGKPPPVETEWTRRPDGRRGSGWRSTSLGTQYRRRIRPVLASLGVGSTQNTFPGNGAYLTADGHVGKGPGAVFSPARPFVDRALRAHFLKGFGMGGVAGNAGKNAEFEG